jgi:acetolactate synthase-1/3 small subunit
VKGDDEDQAGLPKRHVLTITVDNEAGILAKIAGLFTARGYNIDSLTVADITENHAVSRITIVTHGPPAVIDQIHAQLERLVPVHKVIDLTKPARTSSANWRWSRLRAPATPGRGAAPGRSVPRQGGRHHHQQLRVRTDRCARQDRPLRRLMRELGLVEVGRTGVVGMMRGAEG